MELWHVFLPTVPLKLLDQQGNPVTLSPRTAYPVIKRFKGPTYPVVQLLSDGRVVEANEHLFERLHSCPN